MGDRRCVHSSQARRVFSWINCEVRCCALRGGHYGGGLGGLAGRVGRIFFLLEILERNLYTYTPLFTQDGNWHIYLMIARLLTRFIEVDLELVVQEPEVDCGCREL